MKIYIVHEYEFLGEDPDNPDWEDVETRVNFWAEDEKKMRQFRFKTISRINLLANARMPRDVLKISMIPMKRRAGDQ